MMGEKHPRGDWWSAAEQLLKLLADLTVEAIRLVNAIHGGR
jgi:hypothetical protein